MNRVYVSTEANSIRNVFDVMTFYRYKDEDKARVEAQIASKNIPLKSFFFFNVAERKVELLDITKERIDERHKAKDGIENALSKRRERILLSANEIYETLIDDERQRATAGLLTKFLLGRLVGGVDVEDLSIGSKVNGSTQTGRRNDSSRISLVDYVCALVSPALSQQIGNQKKNELRNFHATLRQNGIILPSVMILNAAFFGGT